MTTKREAKRRTCAAVAHYLRTKLEREGAPGGDAEWHRFHDAEVELLEELERRGGVQHRAPRPTPSAPALALEHPELGDPEGEAPEPVGGAV
jgi:hypothetical protein